MKRIIGFCLLGLLVPFGLLSGQECDFQRQRTPSLYESHLLVLFENGCLGEERDSSLLTKLILVEIQDYPSEANTAPDALALRSTAWASLRKIDLSLETSIQAATPELRPQLQTMRGELFSEMARVLEPDGSIEAVYWDREDLNFFQENATEWKVAFRTQVVTPCDSLFTSDCQAALADAAALIRHGTLVHQVLLRVVEVLKLTPIHGELVALDSQWDQYFRDGRSQYVWELLLNGALYDRATPDNILAPPPKGQWILLHPGAGVEFVKVGEEDQSQFNAVALVDLLGYNRTNWGPGAAGSKFALGVSAIATVSLNEAGDRLGWGAMFHLNNTYSVGFAIRDAGDGSETTWIFSTDLAKVFTEVSDQAREAFRF